MKKVWKLFVCTSYVLNIRIYQMALCKHFCPFPGLFCIFFHFNQLLLMSIGLTLSGKVDRQVEFSIQTEFQIALSFCLPEQFKNIGTFTVTLYCFTGCVIKKTAEMNVQRSQILELILYMFKLAHNFTEGVVDPSSVTR